MEDYFGIIKNGSRFEVVAVVVHRHPNGEFKRTSQVGTGEFFDRQSDAESVVERRNYEKLADRNVA